MRYYEVEVDGGAPVRARTITEGRRHAEAHGSTAQSARIYSVKTVRGGGVRRRWVAWHRRSGEGNGQAWYRAIVPQGE